MQIVGFYPDELKRPRKTWKILKSAFIGKNCMECWVCCTTSEAEHRIAVIGGDPYRDRLLAKVRGANLARIEPAPNEGFDIVSGNSCALLEDAGGRKGCKVYGIRPMICAMFPFILNPVEYPDSGRGQEVRLAVMVTTRCPPVKEIRERGVEYLTPEDIVDAKLPVISDSLRLMLRCMADHMPIFYQSTLMKDGKMIFPVL